ncbi:uncharacterized protein K489DRAFT_378556 [Dissoconium aciculare CBS 342.82]|uniref:Haloacid dehalogenase-like hydrolase n=1 Tax=Dissoconium aciculare CBS 342.82 TaxID=1314786 RepID=A0A6J3M8E9_9PEZI|nr:uncharacterized protein K489DRAFT_378556 [Dissoconium aciculare CBS 342.82]KAF1824143.1 hypothetical protein K489DRAFT_378556 [Dissoconium aciculare CBS 342.82]
MSTIGAASRRPVDLILDFDGTLTTSDTTTTLAQISEQSRKCWQHVLDGWLVDSRQFKQVPYDWSNRGHEEYSRWLDSHRPLEMASVRRAQDCDMFKGVTIEHMRAVINASLKNGEIRMRDGWQALFRLVKDSHVVGSQVRILSANWSETFVRTVLCTAVQQNAISSSGDAETVLHQYLNDIEIFANEIHGLGSPAGSSGRLVRPFDLGIRTSGDKVKYMQHMTSRAAEHSAGHSDTDRPLIVYVGDSATDYGALCQADLGIWLCDIPEQELGAKFSKAFAPLRTDLPLSLANLGVTEFIESRKEANASASKFYWSRDLPTIVAFLQKYDAFRGGIKST